MQVTVEVELRDHDDEPHEVVGEVEFEPGDRSAGVGRGWVCLSVKSDVEMTPGEVSDAEAACVEAVLL